MYKISVIFITLVWSCFTIAQSEEIVKKHHNLKKSIAIQGYDPVSYFTQEKAIKGKAEISTTHQGATYYFSSEKNKSLFLKTPNKYIPQYGGWCAYAMGINGTKVKIDPKTFKIIDGELYLFYNVGSNNTLIDWNKDEKSLKEKADTNWDKTISK